MTKALLQAGMHGTSGGIISSIDGSNFMPGFASGAVSSLISSGIESFKADKDGNLTTFGESNSYKAVLIASGGLSGGISSSIAGGNFWMGVRQGIITSGLNHAIDHLNKELFNIRFKNQLTKAGYNLEDPATISHEYIQDMIEKVPILKKVYNKLSNIDINKWKIGEYNNEKYGLTTFTIDRNTSIAKSYEVYIFKDAFSSNLRLASTIGHEMQHITHFNKGLITKWLKGDYTTFNNYASWKSEVKAHKWEMFNINKTEGFSGYIHYEELIRNYYY